MLNLPIFEGTQEMAEDLEIGQLLSSRLCHDLIGAASAINAGLELLGEDGGDDIGALDLMRMSASRLTGRLSFFRAAFGAGGGRQGELSFEEAHSLAMDWMAGGKVTLDWSEAAAAEAPATAVKALMVMVMIGEECLPRGGVLTVHVSTLPDGIGVAVQARGVGAVLRETTATALADGCRLDELSAHNIQAYNAQGQARQHGGVIEAAAAADEIQLAALFPA